MTHQTHGSISYRGRNIPIELHLPHIACDFMFFILVHYIASISVITGLEVGKNIWLEGSLPLPFPTQGPDSQVVLAVQSVFMNQLLTALGVISSSKYFVQMSFKTI